MQASEALEFSVDTEFEELSDRWQGEERLQFRLTDIAPAEPFTGR